MSPVPDAELAAILANLGAPSLQDSAVAALAGLQPEAVCKICLEPLEERDLDLGTHPACDPPVQVGEMPGPTLDALSAALIAYDRGSARSRQVAVGPSEIGVRCNRRLAYALAGAPKREDNTVAWAPALGTAMHSYIADALRVANEQAGRERFLIEQRVYPAPDLSGSTDAYDLDTDTVIDWKLTGKSTVEKAQRHGPSEQYMIQAHTYGRGWQRLGRDPKWVRIVFLPRWSHSIAAAYEWTEPYSRMTAENALARLRSVSALVQAGDVDWAAVPATPTSDACYFCPNHRPKSMVIDFNGCSGYQPKADRAVSDYLDSLPTT